MKALIDSHTNNIYLKPGEVVVARKPVLVSTVLGSCIAVTMFSPKSGFGAICHAMLPQNNGCAEDLRYVDAAVLHIYRKAVARGAASDLIVKLFGGARMLDIRDAGSTIRTVGEQNVAKAQEILSDLGLNVDRSDTGGVVGRKLYFCTRDGDVYLKKMGANR
ncbi:MAG: chemotaxis protein CheD [Geobacter sp.]|nr:chemotaxis protein CheD [Geobacter sp.]